MATGTEMWLKESQAVRRTTQISRATQRFSQSPQVTRSQANTSAHRLINDNLPLADSADIFFFFFW